MDKAIVVSNEPVAVGGPSAPEPVAANPCGLGAGKAVLIFLAQFAVQLFVGFAVGVGFGAYVATQQGAAMPTAADMPGVLFLVMGFVAIVAGGLAAWLLTKLVLRGTDRECGWRALGWRSAAPRATVSGIVGGCLIACVYLLLIVKVFPPAPGQEVGPLAAAAAAGGWQRALWALLALMAGPIEEFVFRGVLWSGLRRSFGALAASIAVTLVFVALHAAEALSYWPAWLAITSVGLATVLLRARSESLVPAIAAHASYNLIMVLAAYLMA